VVLVNTIYLKAGWKNDFKKKHTKKRYEFRGFERKYEGKDNL